MALPACHLSNSFPISTVYSRVKAARQRGTYDAVLKLRQERELQRLVIDTEDEESSDGDDSGSAKHAPTISPVTMVDCTSTTTTEETSTSSGDKRSSDSSTNRSQVFRKSSKQATAECPNDITVKTEYDERYKAAFKVATITHADSVAKRIPHESVKSICKRFNSEYGLFAFDDGDKENHRRELARSTVYQAVSDGLAGKTPKKKGPAPKIPDSLLQAVAAHAEVCHQVGDGELKGKDLQRLIGASKLGTEHEDAFKTNSVWRKVRKQYPQALQAAPKMSIEDGRAQWTTNDNLNQWFTDAKADFLASGMVVDEVELDKDGR